MTMTVNNVFYICNRFVIVDVRDYHVCKGFGFSYQIMLFL